MSDLVKSVCVCVGMEVKRWRQTGRTENRTADISQSRPVRDLQLQKDKVLEQITLTGIYFLK